MNRGALRMLAIVVSGGCFLVACQEDSTPNAAIDHTSQTAVQPACGRPPLDATVLPADFEDGLRAGSGGLITVSESGVIEPLPDQPDSHHHFRGPPGRFIDVVRGSDAIRAVAGSAELGDEIGVAGTTGHLVPIHEGYGVQFELGPSRCDSYLLAGYGVDKAEIAAVARGLTASQG